MKKPIIPIFYACDDSFVKFTVVSMRSMIDNASRDYEYRIHILHTDISKETMARAYELQCEGFDIRFEDVSGYLNSISEKLPLRDYYSKTTYYRFFIAEMFPEYDKAIYIDSDTVVVGDISALYNRELSDCYLGAVREQVMLQVKEYGDYVEKVVGVSRFNYFNAGVLLINCKKFRTGRVLDKFVEYLKIYNFAVTQDEDYLNLICKDRVLWLDSIWNTEVFGEIMHPAEKSAIIHYIMTSKPWHYEDCRFGDIFWKYAKATSYYDEILAELKGYTDEQRERDRICGERLLELAKSETAREDGFVARMNAGRSSDRVRVLEKIGELEGLGIFDRDVEDDPPTRTLMPDEIDYLKRGPVKRLKTRLAFGAARRFVKDLEKQGRFIVKEIRGTENLKKLDTGAVLTCNHFNAYDSFAIQMAYDASGQRRGFWRVIREGNYTSFGGFYGRLMRNCNTLPLSSNAATMKKFVSATSTLLSDGNLVLFYPEQSMWWNYRKPKPLKDGAFTFAARCGVPVVPCFITMKDTDTVDDDGFFVQEYTVHIGAPIYPDEALPLRERVEALKDENARVWREIYEKEYSMPLVYQ